MLILFPILFHIAHSCSSSTGLRLLSLSLNNYLEDQQTPNCDISKGVQDVQNVVRQLIEESLLQPVTIGTFIDLSITTGQVSVHCAGQKANRAVYCTVEVEGLFVKFKKRVRMIIYCL